MKYIHFKLKFEVMMRQMKFNSFTMAEILISLTIIGVIAAITLPSLMANINEKAWATQRKALYSRLSQAIAMMPSLGGYGIVMNSDGTINEAETANKATQTFISEGLSRVLKINNICDGSSIESLEKCGFPKKFTKMGTNAPKMNTPTTIVGFNDYFGKNNHYINYSQINTNAAAFETANGESILTFYNPNCSYVLGMNNTTSAAHYHQNLMQPTMCVNFVYDLNGEKGPNKVGKDIGFITAFYPTDSETVAPYPLNQEKITKSEHPEFSIGVGNTFCRQKYGNDSKMANIEELKSIFVNDYLGYKSSTYPYFFISDGTASSTVISNTKLYMLRPYNGAVLKVNIDYSSTSNLIFCVKK